MYVRKLQTLMLELVVLTTLLLLAGGAAQAAVILEVDVSDPTAVVFTSTDANTQNSIENGLSNTGILLEGFFSGNVAELDDPLDSGALDVFDTEGGPTRQPLDQIFVGDGPGTTPLDVNFYASIGSAFNMFFRNGERALTGSASHDLSSLTGLPTVGTIGNIFSDQPGGGFGMSDAIIGQYSVVPEPGTALLMGLGFAGLGMAGRRRGARRA